MKKVFARHGRNVIRIGDETILDKQMAKVIVGRSTSNKSQYYMWVNAIPQPDPYKSNPHIEYLAAESGRLKFCSTPAEAKVFQCIDTALLYLDHS